MSETQYCWAQQTDHPEISAVTPVEFGASSVTLAGVILYGESGYNGQSGLSAVFLAETTGNVALQGGFSTSASSLPETWTAEFGTWIALPEYHGIAPPIDLSGTIYAWASELNDPSSAVQYEGNPITIQNNAGAVNVSTIVSQTGHYTISANYTMPTTLGGGTTATEFSEIVVQPALSETASVNGYLTSTVASSEPTTGAIAFPSIDDDVFTEGNFLGSGFLVTLSVSGTYYPSIWIDDGTNSSHAIFTPIVYTAP